MNCGFVRASDVYRELRALRQDVSDMRSELKNQLIQLKQGELTLMAYQNAIQAALEKLTEDVAAEKTVNQSAITLLTGLKTQLDAALALGDPNQIVAAVGAISTNLEGNTADLAAAVTANTPVSPAPPAPPATDGGTTSGS